MQPPRFLTERLQLRPAEVADLDALWTIWRDPDVRRYLFDDRDVTRELAGEALGDCLGMRDADLGLWIVTEHGDKALCSFGLGSRVCARGARAADCPCL